MVELGLASGAGVNARVGRMIGRLVSQFPKFASFCSSLVGQLRKSQDTRPTYDLVWPWFRSPHFALAARMMRILNRHTRMRLPRDRRRDDLCKSSSRISIGSSSQASSTCTCMRCLACSIARSMSSTSRPRRATSATAAWCSRAYSHRTPTKFDRSHELHFGTCRQGVVVKCRKVPKWLRGRSHRHRGRPPGARVAPGAGDVAGKARVRPQPDVSTGSEI